MKMKSIKVINSLTKTTSILADDILEFHAARILLLINICGKGHIDGLTKMAKLDFFVRYPQFFVTVCTKMKIDVKPNKGVVESSMVRFHYGPWDHRYYQVLAYLKARGLVEYQKQGRKVILSLTSDGASKAISFERHSQFLNLVNQMRVVGEVLGAKSGNQLKNLVYENFDAEVTQLDLGGVIK